MADLIMESLIFNLGLHIDRGKNQYQINTLQYVIKFTCIYLLI